MSVHVADSNREPLVLMEHHVTYADLRDLGRVSKKGPAPKDIVWEFAHHIADKLLQGTAMEDIGVKATATRFFPAIARSGGDRDRATKYAKIIVEYVLSPMVDKLPDELIDALGNVADTSLGGRRKVGGCDLRPRHTQVVRGVYVARPCDRRKNAEVR